MNLKKILSLVLAFLIAVAPLCVHSEEDSFVVVSTSPYNGETSVSPIDLKTVVQFSEAVDASTLTAENVSVSGGALGTIVATGETTVTVYFKRNAVALGEKYTINFSSAVKSVSGKNLEETAVAFTVTNKVPQYRQISNSDMSDIYYNGAFEGDYLGGDFIGGYIYIDGNPVLKYVPAWDGATANQRVYMEPGKTYTARARVRSDVDQGIGFSITYTTPDDSQWYRIGPKSFVTAGKWTDITYTWSIPENADTSHTNLYIASERQYSTVFIDDWQFFCGINDTDEPSADHKTVNTVVSNEYDSLAKLVALGIIPDDINPENPVTKADAVNIILRLMNMDTNMLSAGNVSLSDVPKEDNAKASAIINAGIMQCEEPGKFYPHKNITYREAAKAILNVMGYSHILESEESYANKAAELGLDKGIVLTDDSISVKDFAVLTDNALDAAIMKPKGYTDYGVINYVKGGSLMEEYLPFATDVGVIDGTELTYLDKASSLRKNRVSIDGKEYITGADLNPYLGCKVEYYYRKIPGGNQLLYVTSIDELNKVQVLSSYDNCPEFYGNKYHYAEDKERVYTLSADHHVIYNGKHTVPKDDKIYVPSYGFVRLVGTKGTYDTVIINDIQTLGADALDTTKMIVYTQGRSKPLHLSGYEKVQIYDKFGFERDFGYIKTGDMLSVMESEDKSLITIYVTSDRISAEITQIEEEGDLLQLTLTDSQGNTTRTTTIQGVFDNLSAHVGLRGDFRLDYRGCVAGFDAVKSNRKVGYLVDAVAEGNMDKYVKFRIYDETNAMICPPGADKIKVDNILCKDPERVLELLSKETAEVVPQLILYDVNSQGEITYIDTAYNKLPECYDYRTVLPGDKDTEDSLRVTYSSVLPPNPYPGQLLFYVNSRSFDGKVQISSSPKIFVVPHNAKNSDERKFFVHTNYWDLGSGYYYCVESYSLNPESLESEYVVLYIDDEYWHLAARAGDSFGFVQDIRQVEIDEEIVTKVTFADGRSCYTENPQWLTWADIGDYICYRTDRSGKLTRAFIVFFDTSHKQLGVGNPYGAISDAERMIYAKVHRRKGAVVEVVLPEVDITNIDEVRANNMLVDISKAKIYRFNRDIMKLEAATVEDILDYENTGSDFSDILMVTFEGYATKILITD